MFGKRVCVVGAGPSGLSCIRQLRDEGHIAVCYEKTDVIGGVWYYREEVVAGLSSVSRATIINTSKEFSAYSDFPASEDFPNFMHNSYLLKYFRMYAKANDLEKDIHFNREVKNVSLSRDHEQSGRWDVTTSNTETGDLRTETFDAVMIATGHHSIPRMINFPGQEKFRGSIIHTHAFKHATPFAGKRVCVVGAGNSAIDAIVELSFVTSTIYMSTRRGVWVRPRVAFKGWPVDNWLATRIASLVMAYLPFSWGDTIMETLVNFRMDHEAYGLKPKHRYSKQHPVTNDALPNCILSGRVAVRPNIKEFTEEGIIFDGHTVVTPVDVVIFGTGYMKEIPFVDPSIICPSNTDQAGGLYKYMFNADLPHPHTLALIGIVHPLGPLHTLSELQARYFAALLTGWVKLPGREEMRRVISEEKEYYQKAFYQSPKHTLQINYTLYMDELSKFISCKPNLWKYFLSDKKLWYHLVFGIYNVYQFRLEGPHSWSGARDAIVNANRRVLAALKR